MKRVITILMSVLIFANVSSVYGQDNTCMDNRYIQFVFCSDTHYGASRTFRGEEKVASREVNAVMLESIAGLKQEYYPFDDQVRSGEPIGDIDYIIHGGDITNRMMNGVQHVADSWNEFYTDWTNFIDTCRTELFLLPGNHDLSNAVGYPKGLDYEPHSASLQGIFNYVMPTCKPEVDFGEDKINYYFTVDSLVFVFAGIWPETAVREWMNEELAMVKDLTWIMFAHDPPQVETRHLTNPNGGFDSSDGLRFENIISDISSVGSTNEVARFEYFQLEDFMKNNRQVKAYFHGHTHFSEFYDWNICKDHILPVFRTDSPVQGALSTEDETIISYLIATIDLDCRTMTVREYFWNNDSCKWGESKTVCLR